jgi:thymidylate synthase (FAD)
MNWCYRDPHEGGDCGSASESFNAFVCIAHRLYEELMSVGVCREQARMVLPQNLYTEYYYTTNVRNLMHFIELRTHEGAQWEIQQVAQAMLEIVEGLWPVTVKSFRGSQKKH